VKLGISKNFVEAVRLGWIMGFMDFMILGVGSRIGRWWPSIGLAIRIAFVGLSFGLVLGARPADYLPWLATGWAVWGMISSTLTNSDAALSSNKDMMLALAMPKEAFVVRVIVKELMLLIQNSVVVFPVVLLAGVGIRFEFLLLIPGLAITAVFLYGLGLVLAPLVARFKDFGPLFSSIIGVMFFVLPIMWRPESIQSELAHLILGLNPLYHYLQIVRLPLLGESPTNLNYLLATIGAAAILTAGTFVMKKTRDKIVYWV
jgi:ABC-type polysaccharide/polyol phosphate export permease